MAQSILLVTKELYSTNYANIYAFSSYSAMNIILLLASLALLLVAAARDITYLNLIKCRLGLDVYAFFLFN